MEDRHGTLLGRAREAAAEEPLHERDELVLDEDLLKELHKLRRLGAGIELDRG